jgi:hypothetical protein
MAKPELVQQELIVAPEQPRGVLTPMDMLNQAVSQGANIEMLEKLMAMQERWEGNQARKAYESALAAAKAEIDVIHKGKTGHNAKKYADLAAIARAVGPVLAQHGLSYRFRTRQDDRIHVTCILAHEAGHAEEHTLAGPADTTGNKNAIQAIGSTLTYLQRYSLVQALGLAASEDDDGRSAGNGDNGPISEEQAAQIRTWLDEKKKDVRKFCEYLHIEAITDLPANRFNEVKGILKVQ